MGHAGIFLGSGICLAVLLRLAIQINQSTRRWAVTRRIYRSRLQSRYTEIGILRQRQAALAARSWAGFRQLKVQRRVIETHDCVSLYLTRPDGRPLPPYQPGQYLTFSVMLPGEKRPAVRCYSLSDAARDDQCRCTIKLLQPPAGQPQLQSGGVSTFLCQQVKEGDLLDAKAPSGEFVLDAEHGGPVVLLAGGIGVTPLISMINTVVKHGMQREVHLIYGVRDSRDHCFRNDLRSAARNHDNVHVHVCYSQPLPTDTAGTDYDFEGRVSIELLSRVLPSNNYDFYLCGPSPFMAFLVEGLHQWGVPVERIHTETFGPSCVRPRRRADQVVAETTGDVTFERSGKQATWDAECESLLDFAEAQGVVIDSGCRAGSCGTCLTAIKDGSVQYWEHAGVEPEPGACLPCICVPRGSVTLDA